MSNLKPKPAPVVKATGAVATPSTPVDVPTWNKGDPVFFNHPTESWIPGEVTDIEVTKKDTKYLCVAKDSNINPREVKLIGTEIFRLTDEALTAFNDDLLNLTELHESTLLRCVMNRYLKDNIYTFIGPLVLSLNPFKWDIPHVQDERMIDYIKQKPGIYPHAWSVADRAFRSMKEGGGNQTMLVSGESGAGKTEACKTVIKYLSMLSCSMTNDQVLKEKAAAISEKIKEASPILEAFGNAKTVNNDNSSRFGKFIKLQFDRTGLVLGAETINYLLEKSRLVTQGEGERSYHIFYQLLASGDSKLLSDLGLTKAVDYDCLMRGDCWQINGVDDKHEYSEVRRAMNIVGMEADEQDAIFRVVAMILHLSNVRFSQDDDNKSKVDNMEVLKKAADLIRVDADKLAHALTTKTIIIMKKPITSNLDKAAASDARDALGKAIYDYMFNWIVWKINQRVCAQSYERFIGLLDIFGFEKFKVNSFEQLCINFANESLQGHYNSYTFKRDMIECADEGIDTKSVKFTDNQECIDLIQGRLGILAMLDEQTNFPKATDKTFLGKLKSSFGKGNNYFSSNPTTQEEFIITHYAGKVEYNVANWLEKNRDQLKPDLVELLITSPDKFISGIVPQNAREQLEATKGDASPAKGGSKVTTLGGSFKKQLLDLMTIINSTTPSWIRCVKPHPAKKPNMFSNPSTINQLRSSGVLETVRLRREGYSVRIPLEEFWKKYRSIIAEGVTNDVTDSCKRILAEVKFTPFMAQVGKTKVFLRSEPYKQLDIERNKRLMSKIQLIQRVGRGYLARKRVRKIREEIRLQKEREEYEKNRELYERLAREREERERVERERREAEERERAYLEELMRQEQERIAKEREERERIERERREAEEQERTKLQELKRKQLLRMDELQKLEREKEDRIRAEQKRIRDEEERILREQAEEEARLLEERRQEMLENERKRVELEKKQRLEARRQKHQERQDEKQRVEEERAARKEKADRQLREEATMKKQRTNEFIELAEIAREKLREEKEAWGRAEWERIQRQIYEEEMAKEAKIEFEREKLRRIEEAQKEFKRRLLEKTQKTYTKVTKAQIRQARLQQQRDEYIIKDMERKEAKKRENERRRHEEEIILMEKQAQMQWEIDKAKRREEMKHTIIKKIREEKIREAWKDKEEVRKEMQKRLQGEKELFELEMKLKQDQESLERKVAEDQLKKKSMYHQELEQAKKDQMEYDYQLELIKRKIGSVFIESPTAGNLSPRNMAGPPQPSLLQKSAILSPRSQANHVSNSSPSILRTSSARSNRSIPGMGSFSTPKKGSFSSLYPNRR